MNHVLRIVSVFLLSAPLMLAAIRIIPAPQYVEPLTTVVRIPSGQTCSIALGPGQSAQSRKMLLAADSLRRELIQKDPSLRVQIQSSGDDVRGACIVLWNSASNSRPPIGLNILDLETLSDPTHTGGQGYVIRTANAKTIWVLGAGDQGVLWGAMTVLQLLRAQTSGIEIPGVYIRDFPNFEFRAAADWLLNVEGNRWALDRGQGSDEYARLVEKKLDEALRYKINMVMFDGFGWSLDQRFPGYPELMRRLNAYARERGIHLEFGGYGASYGMAYQHGPLYEEGAYLGEVFKNRESYPDGAVYRCMGFPGGRKGVDPAVLGSCRSNEELNRLKAEELRKFVQAVQPGALYIHHEDFGGFDETQKMWQLRCERCRKRWPNDSLAAAEGGAGGLANGYSALIRAVNSVKDPATGYDASRDCQVILVSPVYVPDTPKSDDWSNVLELWRNIVEQLPKSNNIQICFRETFPQEYGGRKWTDQFSSVMSGASPSPGIFLFFAGGADNDSNDYPFTGVPALNALFMGAKSIYNFSGDFYQEPMELINAEYSWNVHSTGFYKDPLTYTEAVETQRKLMLDENEARPLLVRDGLFQRACHLLYGQTAGPIMAEYYRAFEWIPDVPRNQNESLQAEEKTYLPMTWNRAYAVPSHWRHLGLDSKTWGVEVSNEAYFGDMQKLKLSKAELHRRLAHRWTVVAEMNRKGTVYIDRALASNPLPDAVDDLRFLQTSFRVYQPLLEALVDFHGGLKLYFGGQNNSKCVQDLKAAQTKAKQAQEMANREFPRPLDPTGGEVGALRNSARRLVEATDMWVNLAKKNSETPTRGKGLSQSQPGR